MHKRIELDDNGEIEIPVFTGISYFKNPVGEVFSESIYKSSIYTDGEVSIKGTKRISRNNPTNDSLSNIEKQEISRLFMTYSKIDEIEISHIILDNPTFYVIMTIFAKNGKCGNLRGRFFVMEDIKDYAVRPFTFDIRRKIRKTYEDIEGLIVSKDVSMLEYFLGRNQVFRLNYEEVHKNIYQLKNRNIS